MFYIGEYDEEEAKEIRTFLSNAGIRVESKPFLVVTEEEISSLHGRHSQLMSLAKDMDEYERYFISAEERPIPEHDRRGI